MPIRVFISYAKEDKVHAEKLYKDLRLPDVEPWVDFVDLIPGQRWELAIRKAINASRYFIALLSRRSVGKRGFVQKEIRYALEIADEYNEDEIFIIPLRIDECEPSFDGLRKLHRIDLFTSYEASFKDVLRAIKYETEVKPTLVKVDSMRKLGTIKRVTDKGFGFLSSIEAARDLFFHSTELHGVQFAELHEGDCVTYSVKEGPKGQVAVSIERA